MLRGCPALQRLDLNMMNVSGTSEHVRLLAIDDFCAADGTTASNTDSSPQYQIPTHIVLKSLHHLTICGTWVFDDFVISLLLNEIFPDILLLGCSGFSLPTIARMLRPPPQLFQTLLLSYPNPSIEEQTQLDMYCRKEWLMDKEEIWNFGIQFQGERFYLLRDLEVFSGVRHGA